jgi:DNA-binding transcriptional regulator YdaS (Cro superfamily)
MDALKKWRIDQDPPMPVKDVARLLGISEEHLWRLENGKRQISPKRVLRISELTGIPPHVLRPDIFRPGNNSHKG